MKLIAIFCLLFSAFAYADSSSDKPADQSSQTAQPTQPAADTTTNQTNQPIKIDAEFCRTHTC